MRPWHIVQLGRCGTLPRITDNEAQRARLGVAKLVRPVERGVVIDSARIVRCTHREQCRHLVYTAPPCGRHERCRSRPSMAHVNERAAHAVITRCSSTCECKQLYRASGGNTIEYYYSQQYYWYLVSAVDPILPWRTSMRGQTHAVITRRCSTRECEQLFSASGGNITLLSASSQVAPRVTCPGCSWSRLADTAEI